jgi:threonine dehydratase
MRAEQPAGLAAAVTREAIAANVGLIRPYIRRTPVISIGGDELGLAAGELVLKLEQLQHSGSFKAHGAFTNLLRRDVSAAGVVAAALAALASGRYQPGPDETVAVIISGANTTAVDFGR